MFLCLHCLLFMMSASLTLSQFSAFTGCLRWALQSPWPPHLTTQATLGRTSSKWAKWFFHHHATLGYSLLRKLWSVPHCHYYPIRLLRFNHLTGNSPLTTGLKYKHVKPGPEDCLSDKPRLDWDTTPHRQPLRWIFPFSSHKPSLLPPPPPYSHLLQANSPGTDLPPNTKILEAWAEQCSGLLIQTALLPRESHGIISSGKHASCLVRFPPPSIQSHLGSAQSRCWLYECHHEEQVPYITGCYTTSPETITPPPSPACHWLVPGLSFTISETKCSLSSHWYLSFVQE